MQYKWTEKLYDTLLYVLLLSGLLIFFVFYWSGEYRLRYAELVINDFLDTVSAEGRIAEEEYAELVAKIDYINPEYTLEFYTVQYVLQPVYAYLPEEKIANGFMERNVKKEKELREWQPENRNVAMEQANLQTETNASILAAEPWVPLPEDIPAQAVEAVRPVQEVYEGESLITLCKILAENKFFYVPAENFRAYSSGTVQLQVFFGEETYLVPVTVQCYPRYVNCENGHRVSNTTEIIQETKNSGNFSCPYCAEIPEKIDCSVSFVKTQTEKKLSGDEIFLLVTYMNGTTEIISPESDGWQDTFDESYCGMQTVEIAYHGKKESIVVLTENDSCRKCGGECNERNKTDYEIFPYCTACLSNTLLFSGEVFEEEICTELMDMEPDAENGGFVLKRGDYAVIRLSNSRGTVSMMQRKIWEDGQGK